MSAVHNWNYSGTCFPLSIAIVGTCKDSQVRKTFTLEKEPFSVVTLNKIRRSDDTFPSKKVTSIVVRSILKQFTARVASPFICRAQLWRSFNYVAHIVNTILGETIIIQRSRNFPAEICKTTNFPIRTWNTCWFHVWTKRSNPTTTMGTPKSVCCDRSSHAALAEL